MTDPDADAPAPPRPRVPVPDTDGAMVLSLAGLGLSTTVFVVLLNAVIKADGIHPVFFFLVMVGGGIMIPVTTIMFAGLGASPARPAKEPPAGPTGVGGQTSVAIPAHVGDDVVPPAVATATVTDTVAR